MSRNRKIQISFTEEGYEQLSRLSGALNISKPAVISLAVTRMFHQEPLLSSVSSAASKSNGKEEHGDHPTGV